MDLVRMYATEILGYMTESKKEGFTEGLDLFQLIDYFNGLKFQALFNYCLDTLEMERQEFVRLMNEVVAESIAESEVHKEDCPIFGGVEPWEVSEADEKIAE